jgi:hypothetical protein
VTAGRVWGGRGAGERGEGLAMRHGIVPQIFLNMLAQYAHTHTHTQRPNDSLRAEPSEV